MAAPIRPDGEAVAAGAPVDLFQMPRQSGWDVTADGERFFVILVTEEESSVTVLLNLKPPR
jgi:hypothetical protein